jgi:hypothetical protein
LAVPNQGFDGTKFLALLAGHVYANQLCGFNNHRVYSIAEAEWCVSINKMPENISDSSVKRRLDSLERHEAKIEAQEAKILETDQHILDQLQAAKGQSAFAAGLYKHRFWLSLLLTVGIVLVWKAIGQLSDTLPIISSAVGAFVAGLAILALIDYLTNVKK